MALYSVDIEKRLGSEFWSNRYIVNADSLNTAQGVASDLVEMERVFHSDIVTFTRYRTSSMLQGDGQYIIVPVGGPGSRSTTSLLPLFNTLRWDITATSGRPSRKYYRGVLGENDINGDSVQVTFPSAVNLLQSLFGNGDATGHVVDPQSQTLVQVVQHPFVQMRQLRRSRRKRENGGGIFQ